MRPRIGIRGRNSSLKLSVIVPVYNEAQTIEEIVEKIQALPVEKELIIVDDGSTNGTRQILQRLKDSNIVLLFHKRNEGKGRAIRTALDKVTGDLVAIQDADLEYDPRDYLRLMKPLLEGKAKVVYGVRPLKFSGRFLFWHYVGNRVLTLLTNLLYRSHLKDMETCYKMMSAEVIKSMELKARRFEFEPEITAKLLKKGYNIYQIPISYRSRGYKEGKKINWRDGLMGLWTIFRYRFFD